MTRAGFVTALTIVSLARAADVATIELSLPTGNDALFHGGGGAFYQYIERDFQGVKTRPWEGGRYGFVRNPVFTSEGMIYTRFHEGIDIKPLHRDGRGDPLDEVRAIADGKVVHVNKVAAYSNYGRYAVVAHIWDGSPYFSLYGHLYQITAREGAPIARGESLGRMGHTGQGLTQARAHLHLEVDLMLSHNFESWHQHYFPHEQNHNGIYNGINLAGIDVARFFLVHHQRPQLTIARFLAEEEIFYKVAIPDSPHFDLPKFYPWMVKSAAAKPKSWKVGFTRSGVPLEIEPRDEKVTEPTLAYVKKSDIDYTYLTRGELGGQWDHVHLTEPGIQLMRLLTWPD